jgi:hypothetical protein
MTPATGSAPDPAIAASMVLPDSPAALLFRWSLPYREGSLHACVGASAALQPGARRDRLYHNRGVPWDDDADGDLTVVGDIGGVEGSAAVLKAYLAADPSAELSGQSLDIDRAGPMRSVHGWEILL